MNKLQWLGFSVSIVGHLLLALVVMRQGLPNDASSTPLVVSLMAPTQMPSKSTELNKRLSKKIKRKASVKSSRKGIDHLLPKSFDPGHLLKQDEGSEDEWGEDSVINTMFNIGLEEYSMNNHFFDFLAQKINQLVLYPKELWSHKISGETWVRVQVNQKGQLLRVIESSKKNPVLSAYILIVILQGLDTELPKRFWYSEKKTLNLHLSFNFSVSSVPTMKEAQTVSYFKNHFEFKRLAKIPNFLNEKMKQYARYIPPVIPTPAGPIFDLLLDGPRPNRKPYTEALSQMV